MLGKVLKTPVDELVELVKKNKNCTIKFLQSQLKISLETIEKWLVILEEYNVITINFKGFEGFVNISSEYEKETEKKEEIDIENLKETFLEKTRNKNISYVETKKAWKLFLKRYEEEIKRLFIEKAKKEKYEIKKIGHAWDKYKADLENL